MSTTQLELFIREMLGTPKKIYNSQYCGFIIVLPSFTTYYVSNCDKSCEFCVLNIFLFRCLLINYMLIGSLIALFSHQYLSSLFFFFLLFIKLYSPLVFSNFLFYYSFILQSTVIKKKINVFYCRYVAWGRLVYTKDPFFYWVKKGKKKVYGPK